MPSEVQHRDFLIFWASLRISMIWSSNDFFFQLVLISSMITLSSCPPWQTISFIPPPNEYDCVYAWTTLGKWACDRLTEDVDFGKKSSWRICKQAKSITFFCQKVAKEYELFSYYVLMEMSDISFETWPHV